MNDLYDDIIHLPHHVSERHPQMSMYNRATQFAPFAALTGHDSAITEAARLTDMEQELSESETEVLNRKLAFILQHIKDNISVEIIYFEPDEKKDGGSYRIMTGIIKESDPLTGIIKLYDGSRIQVRHIKDIKGDCFDE